MKPETPKPVLVLEFEQVESAGYANGARLCRGRARVPGGWVYEFTRNGQPWGVFVPDQVVGNLRL